jgi:hypothetical protein
MPERATASRRSEKSAAVVVVNKGVAGEAETVDEGPNERKCLTPCRSVKHCVRRPRQRGGRC